ncbi:hypothetical protein ACS0TY_032427 [Phlomoides rotata]
MGQLNSKFLSILMISQLVVVLLFAHPTLSLNAPDHFQLKKTPPVFLNEKAPNLYRIRRKTRMMKNKKLDSRSFSAMLPRGYVPPSGSSPCHNLFPNSAPFFCEFPNELRKP